MQDSNDNKLDRRTFIGKTAGVVAGSALASTALSYERILGANDRIALGHIGVGNRGSGLHMIASRLKGKYNVETVAVCDLWKNNRERATANSESTTDARRGPSNTWRTCWRSRTSTPCLIATPEHSHSTMLKATVEAGKDAYCEKPMGNVLEEVKAARDAVKQSNLVVQIGTQHRSEPYQVAAREVVRSGALGDVSKYEIVWNYNGPRWRGRPRGEADPRAGHRLEEVADDEAGSPLRSAAVFRIPPLQGVLQRHPRPVDEPRHRPRALLHERAAAAFGGGARRRLRLARRPRESRHVPGAGRVPVVPGELLHELRQRLATASPGSWARRRRS